MNISGIISSKWFSPVVAGIILVVLAALPAYAAGYTPILFTTIYMYIILSVSWALFSGPTGYMSLATAAFFGVGIYIASLLGEILPLPLFIFTGGLASAVVALLVGALTLRLKGIYFAIFTFGLVMLIAQLLLFFELHVTGTRGRFVIVIDYTTIYYTMLVIFVLLMLTVFLLRRSKWGLALQSIGENEEAAAHIGINVTTVKVLFFALSAFFIGMAGATIATRWTYIDPIIAFDPDISFLPVLMAIFGGMTRSYGPIIGAIIFSYLQEILITKFAELYMLIFGIILVISILYLPNGIVGSIQRLWQKLEKRRYANA